MFNIEEELKKLPNKPGVYIMHDKNNNIMKKVAAIDWLPLFLALYMYLRERPRMPLPFWRRYFVTLLATKSIMYWGGLRLL